MRPGWRGQRSPSYKRGLPGGAVCRAERSAGQSGLPGGAGCRAAGRHTGDAGERGDDDVPGQAGEEQGGRQAVGGDLVGAAVRDALDELVGAEPAQGMRYSASRSRRLAA